VLPPVVDLTQQIPATHAQQQGPGTRRLMR
jgi:hypothetical protein